MGFIIEKSVNALSIKLDQKNDTYINSIFNSNFRVEIIQNNQLEHKWFFGKQVNGVNCFVGRNGTGKTTLLNEIHQFNCKNKIDSIYLDTNVVNVNGVVDTDTLNILEIKKILSSIKLDKDTSLEIDKISYFNDEEYSWETLIWDRAYYETGDIDINSFFKKEYDDNKIDKDEFIKYWLSNYSANSTDQINQYNINDKIEKKRVDLNKYFEFKILTLGMSQGELSRLRQIIKLYISIKKIGSSNISIILDEPEANFHPEWSRTFIKMLLTFLNENFEETKFDIYMTTHSPLIIADLPAYAVHYLRRVDNKIILSNEGKKTFGSELNALFIDNFFLEDKRGEYFSNKLLEIYEEIAKLFLNPSNSKKAEIEKNISFLEDNSSDIFLKNSLSSARESLKLIKGVENGNERI